MQRAPIYWVSQQVRSWSSVISYGKTQTNFLANPTLLPPHSFHHQHPSPLWLQLTNLHWYRGHPESRVYTRAHSLFYTLWVLEMYNNMLAPLQYHAEKFHFLKSPVLCSSMPSPHPWQPLILFTVSTVLLFPEYHIFEILYYVASLDCLISLSNVHLKFFQAFSCLLAHF